MPESQPEPSPSMARSAVDRADGFASRNRNTVHIDQIFKATGGPAHFIAELLANHQSLHVLEVGFGWGIALLELAWRFRDRRVAFYGVDIEDKPELASREGIIAFACEQGIVPQAHAAELNVPQLHFYDAGTLQCDDESMDFIYSAVTIRFMKHKIAFIEEVARVLRPEGRALLHIGESNWNYPYSLVCDPPVLTPFTNRLVLKHGDELIPLPAYLQLFAGDGFEFSFPQDSRCILSMSKHKSGKLHMGLALNDALTMPGRRVPLRNRKGEVRGGIRSVYDVTPDKYRALVDMGLLSPDQLKRAPAPSSPAL
jgi:ubiquinone/menaquinone biosynthesis C-methylase UbiE